MSQKCKHCGSTEIETDPGRGDSVCTNCGYVLEDQILVSQTMFEEAPSGNMVALGQFVAGDSTGGATSFGASYHINGRPSAEMTLQNARRGITHLCRQLKVADVVIQTAVKLYEIALKRNLTRGRKEVLNHAACVYTACRTKKSEVLLIDISDILQLDVHELGKSYVKFAQAAKDELFIIPALDPFNYITRYANKLEFGDKKMAVVTTATRLVQRMKRDSIHTGRRPSGICGSALLIAARLHGFNRTPADIVKVVHIHESTLRKRMLEFGETPSSDLTLDEFMSVDLEEEQDPPAFKAARKKDREKALQVDNLDSEMDELQKEINLQLEKKKIPGRKRKYIDNEDSDIDRFINESTTAVIDSFLQENVDDPVCEPDPVGLGPNIAAMNLPVSIQDKRRVIEPANECENTNGEFDPSGLDDEELDRYILTEEEYQVKTNLWAKVNETYLKEQQEKEEKRLKDLEEGKPEKKKRKPRAKKKDRVPASSPGEAIEKMLKEKKLCTKINYDVLKDLSVASSMKNSVFEGATQSIAILSSKSTVNTNVERVKQHVKVEGQSSIKSNHMAKEEEEEEMFPEEDAVDELDLTEDYEKDDPIIDDMGALRKELTGGDDDTHYEYDDEEEY